MNALRFNDPVYMTVGLGSIAVIDSVDRAHALLNECPSWQRNPAHEMALNACKAALAGDIDVQTARSTFAAFAARIEGTIADAP